MSKSKCPDISILLEIYATKIKKSKICVIAEGIQSLHINMQPLLATQPNLPNLINLYK